MCIVSVFSGLCRKERVRKREREDREIDKREGERGKDGEEESTGGEVRLGSKLQQDQ